MKRPKAQEGREKEKKADQGKESGRRNRDPDVWRGMHRGSVAGKSFEASRRSRPSQAKRRAQHQALEAQHR